MKVVGVDLSLTATGLAFIDDDTAELVMATDVIKTDADNGQLPARHARLETIASTVVRYSKGAALVVIEGPSYNSGGRGTWDRAGLWWWVVSVLLLTGVTVAEISPSTRAKWATNNGAKGKNVVGIAIGRMWPDVAIQDDNAADALVLATMGAQHLGMVEPLKPWHEVEQRKIAWPA